MSTEIASIVARFFEGGKGPTHDELTMFFTQTGLQGGDPGTKAADGTPIGKMKRVRRVLTFAVERDPEAGARLVRIIVDGVRANGGFREGGEDYVGVDLVGAARLAFADLGYELDAEGHVRPATLENLQGVEMTEALWTYVRRARSGIGDAPQVVGTVKDLAEAVARHVLVETIGSYPKGMNFPGTLYQAFDRLGLNPPSPGLLDQLNTDARVAVYEGLYLLACAVNRLRNQEGTGHGKPDPSSATRLDARLSAQASGLVGELLLTSLADRQPTPLVGG